MFASYRTRQYRSLTETEEKRLPEFRNRWHRARLATGPCDRRVVEEEIGHAYRAAGLAPPLKFEWCASPLGIEQARKASWASLDAGPLVRQALADKVIRDCTGSVLADVSERQRIEWALAASADVRGVNTVIRRESDNAAARVPWTNLGFAERLLRRRFISYRSFEVSRWLPADSMDILATLSFLYEACSFEPASSAQALWRIAPEISAIVPHQRICWVSERPVLLATDALGRLHCENGPAVRYSDGWSMFAWKGVVVPGALINARGDISLFQIEREWDPVMRRCMIEILTPQRFIEMGGARRIAVDDMGVLWRAEWRGLDGWTAVEVINGTPEPDGGRKHYYLQVPTEMQTPTEAVAWTYGLSADRYSALLQRT